MFVIIILNPEAHRFTQFSCHPLIGLDDLETFREPENFGKKTIKMYFLRLAPYYAVILV